MTPRARRSEANSVRNDGPAAGIIGKQKVLGLRQRALARHRDARPRRQRHVLRGFAIVDDMPGMWAHELQGRVVRVAPYSVLASYTPEQLQLEAGGPGVPGYLARLTADFSSVLNARGRVWPLPGYVSPPLPAVTSSLLRA